jgi:hypothetical protein
MSVLKISKLYCNLMDSGNSRKYNSSYRKKLINRINMIKDKKDLVQIYKIIVADINDNISTNRNGIFVNMNLLSDKSIKKINDYIEDNVLINNSDIEKINYKTFKFNDEDYGQKLSNQEKHIIKRIRNKEISY